MKAASPLRVLFLLGSWLCSSALWAAPATGASQEAQWIWSPAHTKDHVPAGAACYFRKTFRSTAVESAEVQITADEKYELYVNARRVGDGANWKVLDTYNIAPYLVQGKNTIAVKASGNALGVAGLAARVVIKPHGGTHTSFSTDDTWRTSLKESPQWTKVDFNEAQWLPAQSFGLLGATLPWGNETHLAGNEGRFRISPEFEVQLVAKPEETGSLIAMTFNEFGQIIASRENGPLIRIFDSNADGRHDEVETYCEEVTNCQGLLALNGQILAIGEGPEGVALYRLSDEDQDQVADKVEALLHFDGTMREHGPHGLVLGPDGLIYIMVGNHASIDKTKKEFAVTSPLRHYYEGDLVQPRYEDPSGHAVGLKAPGGVVLRTDSEGRFVELYAGGLRNAYDLAFNRQGDLFTFDSDMEWDIGLPFYRPTRLNHLTPGAELGWRSGWANWPSYYFDGLAATAELGPGSPTGMVFYNHFKFPLRYHNTMFACDWARGQIVALRIDPAGGSYAAKSSVLVEGRPLNATDIAVGPDGWLYFCTGGRDTEGGVYCVTWKGSIPPEIAQLGTGVERAIRQPQLESAWARQQIAKLRRQIGDEWEPQLVKIARDAKRPIAQRTRALDLMQLFGPFPPIALLFDLTKDGDPQVRAKAAYLLGIHADELSNDRLVKLLADENATVRRQACESLIRARFEAPPEKLLDLLADSDRHVAFAARRALEQLPSSQWRTSVLEDPRTRVFLQGAAALLTAEPSYDNGLAVAQRCEKMLAGEVHDPDSPPGFINDRDFTDMLRVVQLAWMQGNLKNNDLPELRTRLAREYPSNDHLMNRELVRLLVTLDEPSITGRMLEQLQADIPLEEKIHLASHAAFLKSGWTTDQRLAFVEFFEQARDEKGGQNLASYMDIGCKDWLAAFTPQERLLVLRDGARLPRAAVAALATLTNNPGDETLEAVIELDRKLAAQEPTEAATRLRTAVVAILGLHHTPATMAYLRELYESDPDRRETIAIGLAQDPTGENWPLLVRSLSIVEGPLATEVLDKLRSVEQRPDDPEALRQAILCGLRLQKQGGAHASALLTHWTGANPPTESNDWQAKLAAWQTWFAAEYPQHPPAELPKEAEQSKWTYQELLSYLSGDSAHGASADRGALVYEKAQCSKCHRYGGVGQSVGPDLSTISRRFQKKEILQAIVFPSHVISDQYQGVTILTTNGRTLSGIAAPAGQDSTIVTQSNGEKVTLPNDEIEETVASKVSVMPEGLLDALTLEQVADLFAYLAAPPREAITSRREAPQR